MFNHKFLSFVTLVIYLGAFRVYADKIEEERALKAAIDHLSQECGKELGIAPEKVKELIWDVNTDYDPCFLNCLFTKPGVINKGIFKIEETMTFLKLYIKDEESLAELNAANENCRKVNDIDISEEDTSCKRADLLYKCIVEQWV